MSHLELITNPRSVTAYRWDSGMGGSFIVSIVSDLDNERAIVRIWYGRATPDGWESWKEWDGDRRTVKKSELTDEHTLDLYKPLPLAKALANMVELFHHNGIYGLIAGAAEHGWSEGDLRTRVRAGMRAKVALEFAAQEAEQPKSVYVLKDECHTYIENPLVFSSRSAARAALTFIRAEAIKEYGIARIENNDEDSFSITDCVDLVITEATLDDAGEALAQAS